MGLGFIAGLAFVLMSDTLLTVLNKHRAELDRLQEDGDQEFLMCLSDDFEAFLLQRMQVSKKRSLSRTFSIPTTVYPNRLNAGFRPKKKHQASRGIVYEYQPGRLRQCCKRKCYEHFANVDQDQTIKDAITTARKPLYDANMDRKVLGETLQENRNLLLLPDGKPCCVTMACDIYNCSKSLLYKDTRAVQTRSEASSACPVTISVCSWLGTLKESLDIMPDGGWYMVNKPRRKMVHADYCKDVEEFPDLYKYCTKSWFNTIWRQHFPEIRLRKHCRFAKCAFCVEWRGVATNRKVSADARQDGKNRLRKHIDWAHKLERGHYHSKRTNAVQNPASCISIAIDGTDKFERGFPHLFEKTKDDDSVRLKMHTICVCVHGSAPYIYIAYENLLSDPNLFCEVLTRVLLAEEQKRGSLPPKLYLQLDNCWRENKNTYTEKYLEWLVERRLHSEVEVSFLPVGHTHFDPDQLASRIGEALKHRDVTSIEDLIHLLSNCYTPSPHVEFIHDVLDWRKLVNPEGKADFPVGTAMCRRARGLCTKSRAPEHQYFMAETSPLHWFIRLDGNGHVFLQTKHTILTALRSEPVYHWDTDAIRPAARECHKNASGLLPSDLTLAARVPLSQERRAVLRGALDGVKNRLKASEYTAFETVFDELCNPTPVDELPLPDHHWTFQVERQNHQQNSEAAARPVRIRPYTVFDDQNDQNYAREQRQLRGHCENDVTIGNHLAYTTDYTVDFPTEQRNEFWLGVVTNVDNDDNLVQVRRYNTATPANATNGKNAVYKPWMKQPLKEWITADRALCQFLKLTEKKRIASKTRRRIANALVLVADEADAQ